MREGIIMSIEEIAIDLKERVSRFGNDLFSVEELDTYMKERMDCKGILDYNLKTVIKKRIFTYWNNKTGEGIKIYFRYNPFTEPYCLDLVSGGIFLECKRD